MNAPSVRKLTRGATSPLRGFFNQHFEMVKHEIRATDAHGRSALGAVAALEAAIADLESDLIEQSLHQARALNRVRSDVQELSARIAELERLIGRLSDVVAAAMLDGDPADVAGRR